MPHSVTKKPAPNVARLLTRLASRGAAPALAWNGAITSARELSRQAASWRELLTASGVAAGSVCAFQGDYEPATVCLILALMELGAIQVPFSYGAAIERVSLQSMVGVEWRIDAVGRTIRSTACARDHHPLISELIQAGHPGLIVFTSGSSGAPKAILHDIDRVAAKFEKPRRPWNMLLMLLIDHFGGFNTLLSCLADGGIGVCVPSRTPEAVCQAIESNRAELLPTTPTFLGVLIASELWRKYDLSSLKLITYGAEPMPPKTLARIAEILPTVDLKQTYGLSELGVLRSSSPEPGSLWLKVGGDGFETRIVEGQLYVRSASKMMGYLNAENPIGADGWMNTGDLVDERDGLIRFLGRKSDVINVGGQKVFPAEVEAAIMEASGVAEAVVLGVSHPLLGNAVAARVALTEIEDVKAAADRLRQHCRGRLQKYKIPMRFEFVAHAELMTERAKKRRNF